MMLQSTQLDIILLLSKPNTQFYDLSLVNSMLFFSLEKKWTLLRSIGFTILMRRNEKHQNVAQIISNMCAQLYGDRRRKKTQEENDNENAFYCVPVALLLCFSVFNAYAVIGFECALGGFVFTY